MVSGKRFLPILVPIFEVIGLRLDSIFWEDVDNLNIQDHPNLRGNV